MRGSKVRTAANSRRSGVIRRSRLDPPSPLNDEARAEYDRLVKVLTVKGTLERVDLAVVAEAGRIKDLLDRAHAAVDIRDPGTIRAVNLLTTQRRGLLRELGLSLQPSRSYHPVNRMRSARGRVEAGLIPANSPWAKHLKVTPTS
jgi:hypothetical protein